MAASTPQTVSRHDQPAVHAQFEREGPSIGELVSDLTRETSELIRKEMELARLEMSQAITRIETGVSSLAIGGVVAFAGFLVLLAAAALGLDLVVHAPWLSALIVGGVAVVLGAVLLALGKSRLTNLTPERSLRSLRRDTELVQEHLPGGGS
jgi:hypothetical protein